MILLLAVYCCSMPPVSKRFLTDRTRITRYNDDYYRICGNIKLQLKREKPQAWSTFVQPYLDSHSDILEGNADTDVVDLDYDLLKGEVQSEVAKTVVERGLSVRETERLVNKMLENVAFARAPVAVVDPNIRRLEENLADKLGAQVAIRHHRTGKGMVVIRYHDVDELEGILAHVK